jgi:hypothetical protein
LEDVDGEASSTISEKVPPVLIRAGLERWQLAAKEKDRERTGGLFGDDKTVDPGLKQLTGAIDGLGKS